MRKVCLDEIGFADFTEVLNTAFCVWLDPATRLEFKLVEAKAHRQGVPVKPTEKTTPGENFSLIFSGPANRPLSQKMYTFEHEQIGVFDLFIVPIGKEPDGFRYEAVFNRTARA